LRFMVGVMPFADRDPDSSVAVGRLLWRQNGCVVVWSTPPWPRSRLVVILAMRDGGKGLPGIYLGIGLTTGVICRLVRAE
jgi:hypothetical protein